MITETLKGADFIALVRSGAAQLGTDKKTVNDLNVFPIPDGDTGDNMYMTITSGCDAVIGAPDLGDAAATLSQGMLLGARGNSGVILSRIFAGISKGLEGLSEADLRAFGEALRRGVEESYKAVSVPVEGTMLTVYREAVEVANSTISDDTTFETYGSTFLGEMEASLERTPDLLDVLKKAGVIDSGGAGLVSIARGIMRAVTDGVTASPTAQASSPAKVNLDSFTEDSELEFGYCTEFLLRLQRSKVDPETFDENTVRDYLATMGDSIVCFKDGSIIKVHVHTLHPGDVLSHCQRWGEFLTLKIENMTLQHHETTIRDGFSKSTSHYGIVTVASGEGLVATLKEAGADKVINGGQTMNPSVQSFLDAFDAVNASSIFVFPNNSNIILTARQAASIYEKADVHVIPSKTFGEGYAAIASFDSGIEDEKAQEDMLLEVMQGVETGMISTATRDVEGEVSAGDFVGFVHGEILFGSPSREEALLGLCAKMDAGSRDVVLIFRGAAVSTEEADRAQESLAKAFPLTEFIFQSGGQPVYDYIIILT